LGTKYLFVCVQVPQHLQSALSLFSCSINLGFLNWGKTCCYTNHTFLLGFPTGWLFTTHKDSLLPRQLHTITRSKPPLLPQLFHMVLLVYGYLVYFIIVALTITFLYLLSCKAISHTRIVALVLFPRWCKCLVCVELYQRLIELERTFILPLAPRWVRHSYLSKRLHTIPYTCGISRPFLALLPGSSSVWVNILVCTYLLYL
jgi:hypothetical protein